MAITYRGRVSGNFVYWTENDPTPGGVTDITVVNVPVLTASHVDRSVYARDGISGSLQTLTGSQAYLLAGPNITLVTNSLGQVAITGSGGGGGGTNYWFERSANLIYTTGSVEITGSLYNGVALGGTGTYIHVEGNATSADGDYAHAEGYYTQADGYAAHAEGYSTTANGSYAHAEGGSANANAVGSHAEGNGAVTYGQYSHAEGQGTYTYGYGAHAEGNGTYASAQNSHAEGVNTFAAGIYSHAEGAGTQTNNTAAHSEGVVTVANGEGSHSEGYNTYANGQYSHTEGYGSVAIGQAAHAEGLYTIASGSYQNVIGKYNTRSNDFSLFVIGDGNGDIDASRSDILRVNSGSSPGIGRVEVTGSFVATLGLSGSLTRLSDGTSYIIAGSGVTVSSASNGAITISATGVSTPTFQQVYNAGAQAAVNNTIGSLVLSGGITPIGLNTPPLMRLEPGQGGPYATNFNAIDVYGYSGASSASLVNIATANSTFGDAQITMRSTGDVTSKLAWFSGAGELYKPTGTAQIYYHPNQSSLSFYVAGSGQKYTMIDGSGNSGTGNVAEFINATTSFGGTVKFFTGANASNASVINSGSLEQVRVANFYAGLSGSLTKLTDGTSYLRGGSGITITSASNGAVTVTSTTPSEWMTVTLGHGALSSPASPNIYYIGQVFQIAPSTTLPSTTGSYQYISHVTGSIRKVSVAINNSATVGGGNKANLTLLNLTQGTSKTLPLIDMSSGAEVNDVRILTSSLDIVPNDRITLRFDPEASSDWTNANLYATYNLFIELTGSQWP